MIKVPADSPWAVIDAGDGDDAVNAANLSSGDVISCGAGADTATVDRGDSVAADCEQVTRLPI